MVYIYYICFLFYFVVFTSNLVLEKHKPSSTWLKIYNCQLSLFVYNWVYFRTFIFEVWAEGKVLIGNMDLVTALATFFHVCFVFDLRYPKVVFIHFSYLHLRKTPFFFCRVERLLQISCRERCASMETTQVSCTWFRAEICQNISCSGVFILVVVKYFSLSKHFRQPHMEEEGLSWEETWKLLL